MDFMKSFKCPICQKKVDWLPTNAFKPFCSERCRLIDLGAWADGTYSVPTDTPLDSEAGDNEDQEQK
jgi:uncharacterized protein